MNRTVLSKQAGNTLQLLVWSAVLCLGTFLAARRAAGGFVTPENSFPACIAGSIVLMAHTWACLFSPQNGMDSTSKQFHATWLGALCFPFAVAAPLLPTDSTFAVMFLLTQAFVTTCVLMIFFNDSTKSGHWQQRFDSTQTESISILHKQEESSFRQAGPIYRSEKQTPQLHVERDVPSQQFQRMTLNNGDECVTGTVQLHFSTGQKQTTAHVLFSPPLPSLPTFEFETEGSEDIRIKPALVQLYGVRIEAHSNYPMQEEQTVHLTFKATSQKTQLGAA